MLPAGRAGLSRPAPCGRPQESGSRAPRSPTLDCSAARTTRLPAPDLRATTALAGKHVLQRPVVQLALTQRHLVVQQGSGVSGVGLREVFAQPPQDEGRTLVRIRRFVPDLPLIEETT